MIDRKLTTKRGQDAWVKNAVSKGMDEATARELVAKMASQEAKPEVKQKKPSVAPKRAKAINPSIEDDFFSDIPLPTSQTIRPVVAPVKKDKPPDVGFEIGQLPLWSDVVRSLPNEILRSALFNAKNRNAERAMLKSQPSYDKMMKRFGYSSST